jgi:2-phosphosulfolactate phosphatase
VRTTLASGVEAASSARGHVVVIDVIRAFTTAAFAFASGATEIALVGTAEEAFALRERWRGAVLMGESGGRPIPGFDFGNSPAALLGQDLRGRRAILRTSSGTQGVVRATSADAVVLGSLVVAGATCRWLRAEGAEHGTLLAMGSAFGPDGPEDVVCATYLQALLRGEAADAAAAAREVRRSPAARLATQAGIDWISPDDLWCAVHVDRFDFAMPVERRGPLHVARAVPVP